MKRIFVILVAVMFMISGLVYASVKVKGEVEKTDGKIVTISVEKEGKVKAGDKVEIEVEEAEDDEDMMMGC